MKIMVAYDGTLRAKEALVYGMDKARRSDAATLNVTALSAKRIQGI